ncbi:hypothetical protein C5E51_34345 [Nocardia nova]|uniref:hypothetical protein n=1 Tax=Nocardia nova TaxID=37330 RepID=UPI000CE9BCFE|nr:hypothetical protein [Nocardia nova]PPJ01198.1 hypothetical protein C5E51_34345 [Nocardia nova]
MKALVSHFKALVGWCGVIGAGIALLYQWLLAAAVVVGLAVVVLFVVRVVIPAGQEAFRGTDPERRADALKALEIVIPWCRRK